MNIEVAVFKFTTSTNTEQWLHPPLITIKINMECRLIITIIASWICRIAENFRERILKFTVLEPPVKVFSTKFGRAVPTYDRCIILWKFSLRNGHLILTDLWKFSSSKVSRLIVTVYAWYIQYTLITLSGQVACRHVTVFLYRIDSIYPDQERI